MTEMEFLCDPEDSRQFKTLVNAFRRPGFAPAVLVGAGTSRSLGYPSWEELLQGMHEEARSAEAQRAEENEARANEPESDRDGSSRQLASRLRAVAVQQDLAWRAQLYRQTIGNEERYQDFLRRTFTPTPTILDARKTEKRLALRALARLGVRHYFTTNYDDEIEEAFAEERGVPLRSLDWTVPRQAAEVMSTWSEPDGAARCIHLHGRVKDPRSIILTEADYQRAYLGGLGNSQRLTAVLMLHPVLFVGFSLNDPDLLSLMRHANSFGVSGARHFAFLPSDDSVDQRAVERARLHFKFGVGAIFFRPANNFAGLGVLLERLGTGEQAPATDMRGLETAVEMPPPKVTEEYVWAENDRFPDDPLKGRFGGLSRRDGWEVSARVTRDDEDPSWFEIKLEVRPDAEASKELTGRVDFFVHPSFDRYRFYTFARNGVARYTLWAFGSFTIGVQLHDAETFLELDLAEVPGAPLDFQSR